MAEVGVKEKLLNLIKSTPIGLPLKDICKAAGLNRLTCTKYLEILEAGGEVEHRNIGMAKLWFAKQKPTLLNALHGEYSVKELVVDERTGEIKSPTGLIVMLAPQDLLAELFFGFSDVKGFEKRVYNVGRNVSLLRAKEYLKLLGIAPAHHLVHGDKIINVLRYYCKSGWGRIKDVSIRREEVRIAFEQSFEANSILKHRREPVKRPVCNIMRGRIAGLFEGFCGVEYEGEETKCRAMGDRVCEFVARPKYLK